MKRLAVLVSGSGTNLKAILNAKIPVALVLADRPCHAMTVARGKRVATELIDRGYFCGRERGASVSRVEFDQYRDAFTKRVRDFLIERKIGLIAMAGCMTVFSPIMFRYYGGSVLNTHPSLLPKFKGPHAVRDALASGEAVTGCTVIRATEIVDGGEVLAQVEVPILPRDTEAVLHERIKREEWKIYPQVILRQLAA